MLVGAIDFAGADLIVGLVDDTGRVVRRARVANPAARGAAAVVNEAVGLLGQLTSEQKQPLESLQGVGSTVPGLVDVRRGVVHLVPSHGWRDVPFADMLTERLSLPVRISNDVNACSLAEHRFGVARGVENLVWVLVSTGVGAGLVLNGRVYVGGGGLAGELGHIVVDEGGTLCGCGHRGCLETVASVGSMQRRAAEMGLPANLPDLLALVHAHEPEAIRLLEATATWLGRALAACVNILDPDLIVLGGEGALCLDPFLTHVQDVVKAHALLVPPRCARIVRTVLGEEAALIGAAAVVL